MHPWLMLVVAIIGEVVATTALKLSDGFTRPVPSITVIIGYGIAFYFLSLTMRQLPMGLIYAVWSGAGIVLIAMIGRIFFAQTLQPASLIGIGLIIAGIVILNLGTQGHSH